MRARMLKVLRITTGTILVVLGVLGTLLPIIPGTPLLLVGLALLGVQYALLKQWGRKIQRWFKANKNEAV